MKNFHLPLPEQTYMGLRAELNGLGCPRRHSRREAVDCWLRQQARNVRYDALPPTLGKGWNPSRSRPRFGVRAIEQI